MREGRWWWQNKKKTRPGAELHVFRPEEGKSREARVWGGERVEKAKE